MNPYQHDALKRKLRDLKKLEGKLRFGVAPPAGADYVWDTFFDLHTVPAGKAKYTVNNLVGMTKEEFQEVIGEFFFGVYYRLYRENGLNADSLFDPKILGYMGLGYDADIGAVKKRFHELALKCHPDAGGDASEFIRLMDNYRKLVDKGD